MTTRSGFSPPKHSFFGYRGDGIPNSTTSIVFTFEGETVSASDWTAAAQIRQGTDSPTILYSFVVTLDDNASDGTLATDQLKVTLSRIPASVTSELVGTKVGDLQLTRAGDEPTTMMIFEVQILGDVTRD